MFTFQDEELSKAATFVMQCCLEPAGGNIIDEHVLG